MPFGLRFKRTRRYDISTKNIYMVEVQMLDGSFLECTLTSDSTGHECLDGIAQKIELQERTHRYDISTKNIYIVEVQMLDGSFLECTLTSDSTVHECLDGIAQKIELQEIHYFGLRYVTKKLQFRWVDLTKPLKKQLEKYAQSSHSARSPRLYFGVIFYIANAHKIVDDVARYQYYLQLKTDIVDGRLPLTVDQVIRLAAYSLQVEFRDYESDRLPSDYFTDNLVFPKNLTKDENILSELMSEVLQAYISLQGVQPVKAEILYMREIQMMDGYGMEYYVAKVCISLQGVQPVKAEILYMREIQMMDGYGMEYYVAKDEKGKELYLGTSYVGIFARYLDGQPPIFFKWTDIVKLQQSKKTFEIDTSKSSSVQFSMEDSDTAKYLKRMCILQQKFYKSTKTLLGASLSDVADFTENEVLPDIQQSTYHADSSADPLNQSQTSLQSLKYHEQKYDQDSRSASIHTDEYYSQSQQSLNVSGHDLSSSSHHTDRRASTPSTTSQQQYQHQQYHQQQPQQSQQTNVTTSTPDPKQDPNYAARLAALPAYRHTPDYQAVMRQKMSQSQQQMHLTGNQPGQHQIHDLNQNIADLNQNIADTHIYTQTEEGLAYSQPEIGSHGNSSLTYNHDGHYNFSSPVRAYPHSMSMYTNVFTNQSDYLQYRLTDRPSNLVMQPTYSSPELNTQGLPQSYVPDNYLTVNEALLYQYKPPPPYPRASNSTPDLAVEANRVTISNSPDLVSRKTLGDAVFTRENQPRLVTSTENIVGVVAEPRNSSFNQAGVTRFGNNTDDIQEPIPEVIQISDNVIQTETGLTEVNPDQQEVDDASSDHSNTTFHVNEIDSEPDEPFVRSVPQRQSSKSKIQVRFVAPNKIPPPSTSKDVATRRESFRRMMIARSGSFTPGVLQQKSDRMSYPNRSLREKQTNSVNEYSKTEGESAIKKSETDTTDPIKQNVKNVLNKVSEQSAALRNSGLDPHSQSSPSKEVVRSQSDANRQNKVTIVHEKAVSVDSSAERKQILERLKSSEPEVPTITENENLVGSRERLVDYEDSSDSDQEEEGDGKPMGPLKLAAMNGLAMSRPMVLALMNYETRAPKDERRKILERKLVENLVFKEFEEMPKKIPEYDCTVAKLPENSLRNRFKDVLPYDHSRVKLNPRKDNSSGYINASHMKLSVGQRIWWYIATQAPMDNTPTDFWQMIWEQEVEVIAMLTALAELGRPKCYPYWPQDPGPENKLIFGDFEVQLLFTNDSLCYITNRISLKHLPSKKERQVWHLQYTDWPDHGCPDDMYGFLGFLDEVESVQRLAESEEGSGKKSPIVVHCSAGVGRTGVVILTQVMKWCLEHNQEIDLPKALGLIRQQRMYMVQTLGQYNFIHKTLIQYLKNTRLI